MLAAQESEVLWLFWCEDLCQFGTKLISMLVLKYGEHIFSPKVEIVDLEALRIEEAKGSRKREEKANAQVPRLGTRMLNFPDPGCSPTGSGFLGIAAARRPKFDVC